MFNWSVDTKKFKKENPKEYRLWKITQLINYGLDGEKLNKKEVVKAWTKIADRIDPNTKTFFEYLLWGEIPSSKNIIDNSWNLS